MQAGIQSLLGENDVASEIAASSDDTPREMPEVNIGCMREGFVNNNQCWQGHGQTNGMNSEACIMQHQSFETSESVENNVSGNNIFCQSAELIHGLTKQVSIQHNCYKVEDKDGENDINNSHQSFPNYVLNHPMDQNTCNHISVECEEGVEKWTP